MPTKSFPLQKYNLKEWISNKSPWSFCQLQIQLRDFIIESVSAIVLIKIYF